MFSLSSFLTLLLVHLIDSVSGYGSMGPIAAAFGNHDVSFFCAIDASGKQAVICWDMDDNSPENSPENFDGVPSIAALSGGEGFMCGILSNTSQAYCWGADTTDLVPSVYRDNNYSHIAAGKNHVCAIRGSYYDDVSNDHGVVDCWDIISVENSGKLSSQQSRLFYDENVSNLMFEKLVSGDGFSCGGVKDGGGLLCWGPNSSNLGISNISENFGVLTSGKESLCGISAVSGDVKCWGNNPKPPSGVRFVGLAGGSTHFCGIRVDNHGVECWGDFNSSLVPKGSGFFAISASELMTCGIREEDFVLDCWFVKNSDAPDPPLQLCSPGLCNPRSCSSSEFRFNASASLSEPDLTSLCTRKDLHICSPCGTTCLDGFFPSSMCTENADRICSPCSLCQNSSCWHVCGLEKAEMKQRRQHQMHKIVLIFGPSISGFLLILIGWCLFPYLFFFKGKKIFTSCIGKNDEESSDGVKTDVNPAVAIPQCPPGEAQIFRLSELKDATNGFKEFNELGRGSYGFVYKAVLTDGRQVAVKRANAATIIHTNIREFELELEILCKLRHSHIVNLLGYCTEMGERILVYEYMSHGTLHDHLHGGLSPLNWTVRLRIVMQAAKGLEYLHRETIVHRDIKTFNILLDFDWGARVSDFGLSNLNNEKDLDEEMKNDVYNFGIVLLEILSGRKAYDVDYTPANIVEWAVPLIRKGKAAATIDRYVALPRNVEPLLRLADIAESAVRENSGDRPTMSILAHALDQIVKEGLML
ncbi:hypothetical protein RND81_04G060800 [Saponaria officinalis]|uniref:non-specific serine/threonine protein kinase n=1 Tax=Saponaria officinalis TaxID=3572 RepID=A0AAW1LGW6_SAPOF